MRRITDAAVALGLGKLAFSAATLAFGAFGLRLPAGELQTLAFVTLVLGNHAVLYVPRERRPLWRSRPGGWVLASSLVDIGVASALAVAGVTMEPLPWGLVLGILPAASGFAVILDQIKLSILAWRRIE